MAVGKKSSRDPRVHEIPNWGEKPEVVRRLQTASRKLKEDSRKGAWRLGKSLELLSEPLRTMDRWRGREDFHYPGTWRLLDIIPNKPDVIHCHNLHGGYFDLRSLPWLSSLAPTVLTLHDAWLLSGHCAHSLGCGRWRVGCGDCPDLTLSPSIERDGTAFNWQLKRDVFERSKLSVVTPSRWLMEKVDESMLDQHVLNRKVIPNGVDLAVFQPKDKLEARALVGLPLDKKILLFTANAVKRNSWKDFKTVKCAVDRLANARDDVLFVALGDDGSASTRRDTPHLSFASFTDDQSEIASYYQAADVYVHAAKADTFPNTIIEALACGTPVVATAVGGIPEQVKSLSVRGERADSAPDPNGILVPPEAPEEMAQAVSRLLDDESLRSHIGRNAARYARKHFDRNVQVRAYLDVYEEIGASAALSTA